MKEVEVERVNFQTLSPEEFSSRYLTASRPVVIEGCLGQLPISRWTMDYLLDRVGDNRVMVRGRTNVEDYKVGRAYTVRESTMKEYIGELKSGTKRSLSSYMAVQNIGKCFPQLQEECKLPVYVEKIHNGPFLWVARQGHYEYCHFDPDASMLMMVEGRKQTRLYSSHYLHNLYPNPLGSMGKTVQSQVDCDNPDLEKFPLFSDAVCETALLNPGDMLFIPAFWWHQVSSLTASVSVNVFFGESGSSNYVQRLLTSPHVRPSFLYWILNIVEQNKDHSSFQRSLQRLDTCVSNLLLKHFHEVALSEQVEGIRGAIMRHLGIDRLPTFEGGGNNPPPIKIRGLRWRSSK